MILVVGATGVVGGMITRRLLEENKEVRVLIRRDSPTSQLVQQGLATSAESLIEAGAQPSHGDLRDRASLDAAVEGVETVISTANSAMRGGADNPQSVDLDGNRNLIEAARNASVEHFIFISLLGADPNHPAPLVQAKAQSEASLRASGMEYTILAPTAFMEVWPAMVVGMPALQGRPVTLVGEGRRRHSFISNRDVAAFAVAAVDHSAARNQYLAIGGPEPHSWRDVVATYERVLGRSVPVEFVAAGEPVPGLPDPMPNLLADMETYDSVVEMDEIAETFGVPLTPLETFVREQVSSQSA
ncbi:MAG: SDR family oxidoreductase [Actinomycetota bacterium]|nr:SDR family oxidoreductase [Actinomycetota bacterium]